MSLPCPGPSSISLLDIQNEFGGANPIAINEYYRGGLYVANNNVNIPTSGMISFDNFFCSAAELVIYITQHTQNLDVRALFEETYPNSWTSGASKRLVINSGVIVFNTNPYAITNLNGYALRIYDTFNGTLKIENLGSIQGAAGRRGGDNIIEGESRTVTANGGQGGNAIYIGPTTYGATANSRTVSFDNKGTIYAGGGGGGQGGSIAGGTIYYNPRPFGDCCPLDMSITSAAAAGGIGGSGQGYNQSNTVGAGGISSRKTIYINISSISGNSYTFPPNCDVYINAYASGQVNHKFSSNSNIFINAFSSGIQSLTFSGSNNYIAINRFSSGLAKVVKHPNQNFQDNPDASSGAIQSIQNSSILADSNPNFVIIKANGNINQTFTVPVSGGLGGTGATVGNTGATGAASGFPGGGAGYAIVGKSTYVSYIDQGTIAGLTN